MVARPFQETNSTSRLGETRSSHASRGEASPALRHRGHDRPQPSPNEIDFLVSHGVAASTLVEAAARARRLGVAPLAALLADGGVSDHFYYSARARRLGAPFVASAPAFTQLRNAHHEGPVPVARLADDDRYLIAPEGEALRALLALAREGRAPLDRIAITTPRRLAAWTRAANARAVARAACDDLRRHDPSLSAATPCDFGFRAGLTILVLGFIFALVAGGPAWVALTGLFGVISTAVIAFRLAAAAMGLEDRPAKAAVLRDADLPGYTIIVPLYREARVVARLVRNIEAIDYPRAKLDIRLVVEAEDHDTRAAIEALALPGRYEIVVAPRGAPRTKPRALNVAMAGARGSLIVIFDAEDAPDPDQLRLAARRFGAAGESLACLQARLAIDNPGDGWLAALFAIEYAALFDVLNPGLAAIGAPMLLGGTSNHFRASALRRLRGWDAWNVTEDADLGLRLARFGYRVETLATTTHEEAPARIGAWLAQRRRWIKGWMQTLLVHGRQPRRLTRELGPAGAAGALALLINGVLGPLLTPMFVALLARDAIWGDLLAPRDAGGLLMSTAWSCLMLAGAGSLLWFSAMGVRQRGLRAEARWLVALPAYHLLLSVAAWGALLELWRDPFGWSKTSHGLARTSRRNADHGGL